MPNTNPSANMSLPIPVVGVDPGPDWATNVNTCLTLIDSHDHTSGRGVQITPSGLNISSDLSFLNNDAINLRSVRFTPQSAVLVAADDLGCLYEVGVDLYYNDGSGNHIRLTQSGAVAGTPGSISNLVPPASASYNAGTQTFVWQSDANTPANMDAGFYIFRNNSANSKGLTLSPPLAMGSDYSLVLPSLPAQTNIMTLDASGNIGASLNVDNSTLQISSNVISVKNSGITPQKLANLIYTLSGSSGNFTSPGTTNPPVFDTIPNLSVTITTTGRPVFLQLQSDGSGQQSYIAAISPNASIVRITRDGTEIATMDVIASGNLTGQSYPPSVVSFIDTGATAATHTYLAQYSDNPGATIQVQFTRLIAYQL